ncbi:MAG TPA: hypothetical protein PKE30_12565 [Niabella sp.]|nr:hypothetical protein [Niabella sp.]
MTQPNQKKSKKKTWIIIAGVLLALFIIGSIPGDDKNKPAASTASTPAEISEPTEQPQIPVIEVTAKQLVADYNANEVSADNKYKGKQLKITGVVESINKDFTNDIYLIIKGGDELFSDVHAYFDDAEAAAKISKGQKITFTGVGSGFTIKDVIIKEAAMVAY